MAKNKTTRKTGGEKMSWKNSVLMRQRYSITEKQLQGLVRLEHYHSRECLANAVRKQPEPEPEKEASKKNGKNE